MSTPAGWHKEHGRDDGRERYWDGTSWTDQYRFGATEGAPGAVATTPKSRKHLFGYAGTAVAALIIGAAAGGSGGDGAATAGGTPTATTSTTTISTTVTQTVAPKAAPAVTVFKTVTVKAVPAVAITEGVWEVGVDIKAGTYKVIEPITSDCYWSITRTGTDDIVSNGIPTGGRPVLTLKNGQTFTNQGCGDWGRVK